MPTIQGILGQSAPDAQELTDAYTVPTGKVDTVRAVVCNRATEDKFRLAVSPNGAAIADEHYMVYDMVVADNDSVCSAAFTVKGGDVVRVYSENGNLSFTFTGIREG